MNSPLTYQLHGVKFSHVLTVCWPRLCQWSSSEWRQWITALNLVNNIQYIQVLLKALRSLADQQSLKTQWRTLSFCFS